jgi:ubiquinone/menaquinone biosynthesis C-methylase UbiE
MKGKMSNIAFKIMAHIAMPIRNRLIPPAKIMAEIDIPAGSRVLDYGCGPGVFSLLAAERTGPLGKVYALDIHPLAVEMVAGKACRAGLDHIETVLSGGPIPADDGCIDVVLFLDVLHLLENPDGVIAELCRVLKPGGRLIFSDHHMKRDAILTQLAKPGGFRLIGQGERVFIFGKERARNGVPGSGSLSAES